MSSLGSDVHRSGLTDLGALELVQVIPVGTSGGASMLPFIGVLGGWATSMAKGKGLMVPMFEKLYPQVQVA